ncbi:MAG: GNAT family N-acetyltransferase [Hyphomicrobiales bacterium]
MTEITIRSYTPEDEADVIAVVKQMQAHEMQFFDRMRPVSNIGPPYITGLIAEIKGPHGRFLVADHQSQAIAFATLDLNKQRKDDRYEVDYTYAQVEELAVLEPYRGQGIGQKLLAHCERLAQEAGHKWLRISLITENPLASRAYSRAGFGPLSTTLEKVIDRDS